MASGQVDQSSQIEALSAKAPKNLFQLLVDAARNSPGQGLQYYAANNDDKVDHRASYADLLQTAQRNASKLRAATGVAPGCIILLHFDNHRDNIEWIWAAVAGGFIPAMSTPLSNDTEQRKRHLMHLHKVLKNPVVLTKAEFAGQFKAVENLNVHAIEEVQNLESTHDDSMVEQGLFMEEDDIAFLMLTSGSTGNAKAVCLRHGQVLQAVKSKSTMTETTTKSNFLNWIGLDHVAGLIETHLHAMSLGAEQVHVQAIDLLANPTTFLELVHQHRATYSFAPNFFLAALHGALASVGKEQVDWDLSCLTSLISGGEANVVETAAILTQQLRQYGAPEEFICPAFGMTETCGGSVYNKRCPSYDIENKWEFASLGSCISGLQMRVRLEDGLPAPPNEVGSLELSGPLVFREYYNNAPATRDWFTADGWFMTGDRAFIDKKGNMSLSGRVKETIIINGVKYFPHEVESALEEAHIKGITQSFTSVFPHRPMGSQTEVLCVAYLPSYNLDDVAPRVKTADEIIRTTLLHCGVKPYKIIPLEKSRLPKTTLGKLSRSKIQAAFDAGKYDSVVEANEEMVKNYRLSKVEKPRNDLECAIQESYAELFQLPSDEIGLDTSLYDVGVTSIEVIKLAAFIRRRLKLQDEIPVITLMTNPTVRSLAAAVDKLQHPREYEPVICLQPSGDKTPLFLVHPGIGEILVFLNLAKHLTDRPVYAIRAKGFDGEGYHQSIPEIIDSYYDGIKRVQPHGPYALGGYSFGAMLAFETAKRIESRGDEVKFLASFSLPPHIKTRMRQLDWIEVFLNLAYFLDLISDDFADAISPDMHKLPQSEVLDFVIDRAPPERMEDMALTRKKLAAWTSISHWLHCIAHHYDPTGSVASIDVFYATPLQAVAKNKQEWVDNHLSKWDNFVREDAKYIEVDGAHYTIFNGNHVGQLQKKLKEALAARGV